MRITSCLLVLCIPATALAEKNPVTTQPPARLEVTSKAFGNNEAIPIEYTCEGKSIPPPLTWSKVPAGTRSIAILVDDPDAPRGTFTHWLVTGIPPTLTTTTHGLPSAIEAKNSKGTVGFIGPCPPSGRHHYRFQVYALDIEMPHTMTRAAFLSAIEGHVLATGELVGTYQRQRA